MIRQGLTYVQTQLQRFETAKEFLLKDDDNYANHEEKRQTLLKYYDERIKSYQKQISRINEQGKNVCRAQATATYQQKSQ